MVGVICGLCNAFPNIVVNCCFQLPKSQSVGCATTNSCRGSGIAGACTTCEWNRAFWLQERASAGPLSLPAICKAENWKVCSTANRWKPLKSCMTSDSVFLFRWIIFTNAALSQQKQTTLPCHSVPHTAASTIGRRSFVVMFFSYHNGGHLPWNHCMAGSHQAPYPMSLKHQSTQCHLGGGDSQVNKVSSIPEWQECLPPL